jgi:hypothetical protein
LRIQEKGDAILFFSIHALTIIFQATGDDDAYHSAVLQEIFGIIFWQNLIFPKCSIS